MTEHLLDVQGAAEHNLRDVDVTFGPGLTAVVGVSGSGKSSLAFDVVYAEARRRFIETFGRGQARMPVANVRRIDGLGPAVAIAQNVLNLKPASTVATSVGLHPFLRILYARCADVTCPRCSTPVRAVSGEQRLTIALDMLEHADTLDVDVAIVHRQPGSHARLLAGLRDVFDRVTIDGRPWAPKRKVPRLDPATAHDVVVRVATLHAGMSAAEIRGTLEQADALGPPEVRLGGTPVLRAPICPTCAAWVRPLEPAAFRDSAVDTSSHRIDGVTITELLARSVSEVLEFVEELPAGIRAARIQDELLRRLRPLVTLGLGHLALDRSMPTLSRGEAQRTRLAVVLGGRLEDLLHVLDEPTIGLHHTDLTPLLDAMSSLPGPVLMVEHDRTAIAMADDVVEIGPAGGRGGGELVFHGPPAALWRAETASGRSFSASTRARRAVRDIGDQRIGITGANVRNLRDVDCEIPVGALTVITGPSGAGKTTLARDVLLASIRAKAPIGCSTFDAPALRAIAVDQKPLGNNPRSNPATYTKVFDRIREVFAAETGQSASEFTFNRAEGACPECEGMGSVAISLSYLAPIWVPCDACNGNRYRPEVLEATWDGRSIADVLELSVDEAAAVFVEHRSVMRILQTLQEIGLGYVTLGQPSPSLSGGEAQRIRLTREVARAKPGSLVLLDEPTTGLHPGDLDRLLAVLDKLTVNGCTVIVVEHQADVIAAADWRIDLGPRGGPDGGRLLHCGPPVAEKQPRARPRATPRAGRRSSDAIRVRGARAHNLQSVDVDFAKGRFTVVTGVSGSGKSSLVRDVVAAEAGRRLLECLSVYERQSVREGPEAPVDVLTGLGPTTIIDAAGTLAPWWSSDGRDAARGTVGRASDLDRLISLVLARSGVRTCLACGSDTVRRTSPAVEAAWNCENCATRAVPIEPRHLRGSPIAICPKCLGQGVIRQFPFDKWVVRPDAPICAGCFRGSGGGPSAMSSASMALLGYFCKDGTGGNASLRAFAERHGFDLGTTPWSELTEEARQAFMFGDPSPTNEFSTVAWIGINHWAQHDLGGADTTASPCPECGGHQLRAPYLAIRLQGRDRHDLFSASLAELEDVLGSMAEPDDVHAADARTVALHRLRFLRSVGLGYLHLNRAAWTLSAGEAQRVKLASVLGSDLVGMTVLLDEPSRGLHPSEVGALARTLTELRDAGNTVIAVEHDPTLIRAADDIIEIGPGPGRAGGRLIDLDSPESVTRAVRDGNVSIPRRDRRREPTGWMHVTGARENNLRGLDVRIPLGVQVGVCGVSGSGKSSLVVDTVALGLARPRTNIPGSGIIRVQPGLHDAISGAPGRTIVADQTRAEIASPGMCLGLINAVRKSFAAGEVAREQGVTIKDLTYGCDACGGKGSWPEGMSFLPAVTQTCEACGGSGYRREVATLVERNRTLADIEALTIAELVEEWGDIDAVRRVGDAALALGLGYLIVRQPGWSLSGGEAQRLKLAKQLARPAKEGSLYVLDEPTVGLQVTDVAVLSRALDTIVDAGNTVLVVEHDPVLLAACDWLIELGPGAGPDGGEIVFAGRPEELAAARTATAPYILEALA